MRNIIVTTSWDDGTSIFELRLSGLLKKYNLKGTFYISQNLKLKEDSPVFVKISEEDIKKISVDHEIGAHTLSHIRLAGLDNSSVGAEVGSSKKWLEGLLNKSIKMFAYPYGSVDKETEKIVKENGFIGARTTDLFKTTIENAFLMGTTIHCYPFFPNNKSWSLAYRTKVFASKFLTNFRTISEFKLPIFSLFGWSSFAISFFEYVARNGGIFHIWGHSWEIEKYNLWNDLEKIFQHISNRKDVSYLTNSEVINQYGK